jgi:hypothetical protein
MKTASSCTVKAGFFLLASVLLLVLGLGQNTYTPYTFITFAGSPGINASNNGVGNVAHFNHPGGVAVDASNNVYVADQKNGVIRKITPGGTVTTIAGTVYTGSSVNLQDGTNVTALFSQPSGVTVDGAGNLFIADYSNNAIRKVRPSGTNWITTTVARGQGSADGTNGTARFSHPHDVAVDGAGNIFVADVWGIFAGAGYTIRKIAPVGTNWVVTTIAGQAGVQGTADGTNNDALFYDPETVTVDTNGNVFGGDNRAVREITPLGTNWVVTTIAGSITNSGTVDGTNTTARFNTVRGLEINLADGSLYVADLSNLIRKVTPIGTNWVVTTLAGAPGTFGTNDGAGNAARFDLPCSVALDGFGNLYVADYNNSTIRKGFPFAITNQPQSQAAALGTNVTLGVSLFGNGPFLYQWSFGGTPLTGQTNAALPLNSVQRTNSGLYSVAVTGADTNDIVASSNAVLRVLVAPVLQPPQISSDGKLRLRFQDSDGGVPFDLNSLEVQWRTNLPAGPDTNWQSLTSAFYLTNGVVEIDNTNMAGVPSGFYRVIEH